jgi:CRP-like cAMP-binding protein
MYGVLLQDSLNNDNFVRVCKMLVYLAHFKEKQIIPTQKEVSLQPNMTQNDMARLMGIHRVTVTKALSRLRGLGIIDHFSKKSLLISDFPALCQLIEADSD